MMTPKLGVKEERFTIYTGIERRNGKNMLIFYLLKYYTFIHTTADY